LIALQPLDYIFQKFHIIRNIILSWFFLAAGVPGAISNGRGPPSGGNHRLNPAAPSEHRTGAPILVPVTKQEGPAAV
jgi:hypothetical protein